MAFARLSTHERLWLALIVFAGLLVFSVVSSVVRQPSGPGVAPGVVPEITPGTVPLVGGEEPIAQIFKQAGCAVCHTIPGIEGADGRVGPKLALATSGPQRLADPSYKGQAKTVREYIVESVLSPGIYTVPGYPALAMPRWYGQKLSALALDKIASYLEPLKEEG